MNQSFGRLPALVAVLGLLATSLAGAQSPAPPLNPDTVPSPTVPSPTPASPSASTRPPVPGTAPALNWALSVAQIKRNCATQIALARKRADAVAKIPASKRTFVTVVKELEDQSSDLGDQLIAETLLYNVSTDRKVRDASLGCQNDVNNFSTEVSARPDIYRAVAAIAVGGSAKTVFDRKLTSLWLIALKRSGAGLSDPARRQFVTLSKKLNELQNNFQANLNNDTTTVSLTRAQLRGLPADFVATLKVKAGRYVVPVNESTSDRFMSNAADAVARRTFYFALENLGYPKNDALLRDALAIRDRLAHLLGYPSWAAYVLADRMAGTPQRVERFLLDLDRMILPKARRELATLAVLKGGKIDPWDVVYYDRRLNRTKYAVDTEAIRQYFPVEHVVKAVFDIYATILGVRFTQRNPAKVWVSGVTEWVMSDAASGRYIGDFYLDLFPRPGKYSHVASFWLRPVRRLADGTRQPPLDAIIGNWPQPAPGKPALLTHEDVVVFFHEFGHNMATMLARAPYETLTAGFRQDFVEAPSQMLENFVWDPAILGKVSANVKTGAPLPDTLIAKMRAARYVDYAYWTTRQILLAQVDMRYHSSGPKVDSTAIWRRVARDVSPLPAPPGIHPEASFGHIMGGYDAGYYAYLWSKVYAQDLFTAFQHGGLESPVVGARYRHDILEPARTYEPDQEVQAFLGRPMSPAAFYREFGATGNRSRS